MCSSSRGLSEALSLRIATAAGPTMCPETTALRHNAFVYDALDTYVERSVAFLRDGLQNGEGAVVANTRAGIAAMRDALGVDADEVTFVDVSAAYTRPAKTLAAYHRVYARQLASTGSLRAVAEVQFGPHPAEWDMWTGYEAVFNRAFAHLPAWVLCSYNADAIPDAVLEGVWKTHPQVLVNDDWSSGDHYVDPDAILRESTADPAVLSGVAPDCGR